MAQEPLILFLHLPKTAGLTLRASVMMRQYAADEVFYGEWGGKAVTDGSHAVGAFAEEVGSIAVFDSVVQPGVLWYPETLESVAGRYRRLPAEARARVRLITGQHIEYGLHEHLDRPVSYFTLLREPVARVLSHYDMARERSVPEGMSLPEHVAACVESNLQTRLLAGPAGADGPQPPPAEEMLRRAKEHLRGCTVVGLTERFDETLVLLKKAYGWRMPFYERRNVGRKRVSREVLPGETVRQIEADNYLDVELYALAQELFAEQVRGYGPALARDLRLFRLGNWAWQRSRMARERLRRVTRAAWQHSGHPVYDGLARWGGLRRLVPRRYAPRVVARAQGGSVCFDLLMGRRVVGRYDPRVQRWRIRRPFRLVVDERALPGKGGRRKDEG